MPCRRQFQVLVPAIEKRRLNFLFQIADLPAEWRLRYAKPGCSPADIHFFSGCDEIPQVTQFHLTIISHRSIRQGSRRLILGRLFSRFALLSSTKSCSPGRAISNQRF
jgi:hypothetical protein